MFETLLKPEPDRILAAAAAARADARPEALDLTVGVYKSEEGATPVLRAVKEAERRLLERQATKTYVGPTGDPAFGAAMIGLVFGEDAPRKRLRAAQTPGGGGALRLLADLAHRAERGAEVWLPDPTWPNHFGVLRQAGLGFRSYPYFDPASRGVDFDRMTEALSEAGPGDVVLLHGCCHNPTGADLSPEQWRALAGLAAEREFTPFVDLAYQGFGDGLDADAEGVRILAAAVPELLVAASCSKNFALYRERVGCAFVLGATPEAADLAFANLGNLARANWSMPPDHGAACVREILEDPGLRADWEAELAAMRERITGLRRSLAETLRARANDDGFDFLRAHRGMFSLLGIDAARVVRLREAHAVHCVPDGRINVAGLNAAGVRRLADALAATA
jgi:aromatic-amino-acid transaminase